MILDLLNYESDSLNSNIFKFRTDAVSFKINYQTKDKVIGNYPHFGITAREGLAVLYKFVDEDVWFVLDVFARHSGVIASMKYITDGERVYDVMIYGPSLTSLTELNIEIPEGSQAKILDTASQRKMMLFGGLNSFGIGCTTSPAFYSNIIQRTFDVEMNKVVFNTNNYLDKVFTYMTGIRYIPDVDVMILEIDCTFQNDALIDKYLPDLIDILRSYSKYLICWMAVPDFKSYKYQKAKEIIGNYENVFLLDLSCIYGELSDMCTYSSNFINDSANIVIYQKLSEKISEVTNWNI